MLKKDDMALAASNTASDSAGAGLARLYRARFSPADRAEKNEVWAILCEDFFSRFVNQTDRVFEIPADCFVNHIKRAEKSAGDADRDTVAYAANDFKSWSGRLLRHVGT